jgi:UDP-2,3-diacylglucosamine pyrophosphatase LpxH
MTASPQRPLVADRLAIAVPPAADVVVISDIHLHSHATAVSTHVERVLASRLHDLASPAVVVLAGDTVELLGEPGMHPADAFASHRELATELRRIAATRDCQVVCLVGNHDGELAWNDAAAAQAIEATGGVLAVTADLVFETDDGPRKLRVEHGNRFDPYNCFTDIRQPLDTPLGHHIVREALPLVTRVGNGWIDDAIDLVDPIDFPSFVGSRLAYRRLATHLRWLLIPLLLLIFLVRTPVAFLFTGHLPEDVQEWLRRSAFLGAAFLIDIAVIVLVFAILVRRSWQALRLLDLGERGYGQNASARQCAARLVDAGYLGLVCGHSHRPELTPLRSATGALGVYANTGSGTPVVEAVPGRFAMPPVYLRYLQVSWLEIGAACGDPPITARLVVAEIPLPGASRLEHFLAGRARPLPAPGVPTTVATWPGAPWPPQPGPDRRARHA